MLPAIVIEKLPRLVRAIKLLPTEATPDEAAEAVDSAEAIITASQGFLDQLGLF